MGANGEPSALTRPRPSRLAKLVAPTYHFRVRCDGLSNAWIA
jgi:hypothetical protein